MKVSLIINEKPIVLEADPDMPLLWAVRDLANLKGTKFGCGKVLCGACSLYVDGDLIRSCSYPVKMAEGKQVTTIEGLSEDEANLHPVQQAWMEIQVPQCGYCQPGFMMAAAKLLEENPTPTVEDIKNGISNICRCGTHPRIINAILLASKIKAHGSIK
ncbi:isoquinoline 1-oxidoreductase alpha subunit [Algoriphagus sp. 4150]|uniref:(2Fe-2S)-binding protein n=1 Tax=Algoriphagus sp. 4150 TaxID=2817756 RepID=UPI002863767E|nr:2Fe-2S iron-sulfur cluster-binding protein [Algoriphagus sp. 4150]MDR7131844.1 isoquinoline 1-oxidoreductase alpha subunit [Algoriphagus sp. 4150]